ncbi:hypothetical protein [Brucella anthropi]|nr:hypothetical protein [Brucella anthropi]UGQ21422.1 hypothetical protein LRL11_01400 [Brucella anthropi]
MTGDELPLLNFDQCKILFSKVAQRFYPGVILVRGLKLDLLTAVDDVSQ